MEMPGFLCREQFVISRSGVRIRPPAPEIQYGGVPEWPKGTDCKSAGDVFGGSNPPSSTTKEPILVTKSALCVFLVICGWRNQLSESSMSHFRRFPVLTPLLTPTGFRSGKDGTAQGRGILVPTAFFSYGGVVFAYTFAPISLPMVAAASSCILVVTCGRCGG